MKSEDVSEIIECLPKGRTLFSYHKDRYAVQLLEYAVAEEKPIAQIRSGRFGKLLDRPLVKNLIATCGSGVITRNDLDLAWSSDTRAYLLTLGRWGPEKNEDWEQYWYQTSRPGQNLVLQLNFSNAHNDAFQRILQSESTTLFNSTAHPVRLMDGPTLAWARLDVDLDRGEALIEELQSDWIWNSRAARQRALRLLKETPGKRHDVRIVLGHTSMEAAAVCRYYDHIVAPHAAQWDQAMLSATIWFLVEELGLRRIYLHDHMSGCKLKGIGRERPPRSLYTKLPNRFCFEKTADAPDLLRDQPSRRFKKAAKNNNLRFWRLYV
ncbi:MAG: hypothetical protein AAF441_11800 [Pseudomonadota bacterium]